MAVQTLERMPPQSLEAEVSLLGAMLLDNTVIDDVLQYVSKDSFYKTAHQELFQTIVELYDKNQAVDLVLLKAELERRGSLEKVGGLGYLMETLEVVPSIANAEYYANLIRDNAIKRDLIEAAVKIQKDVFENRGEVSALLDKAERRIFDIAEKKYADKTLHIEDLISAAFKRLENMNDRKGRLTGLSTGLYDLDDLTCGFQPSQLIVVAGRPSMGKSSLVLNIMQHVGVVEKLPVVLFSLEMDARQIAQNMLCSYARLNTHKVRKGGIPNEDWGKLSLAAEILSPAKMFIDDAPGLSIMALRAKARRMKAQHDIKLLAVDYLQLMDSPSAENRQQEISNISRGLKSLAMELDIPIIAVSQLNRSVEMREEKKPRMSDLRESGSIEQDADLVLLLHRDGYYNAEKNPKDADLIIAKQRNGPIGTVKLTFLNECMRFESAATLPEDGY
ncbi:MAG: replicative DNA helicase [Planctomycetes bacterium RIFCSPLOWO2_02_FULL_50_16]|nr:MAG: replicative DNA helicase [Planctomycetes bacterium RIFCSPLOWO2_02_FULL_50_16]